MCSSVKFNSLDHYTWAENFPEIQKACYLSRVCSIFPPKKCQYQNISSIRQQGPTCGLVAISMLLSKLPSAPSPMQLLEIAKERKYTKNGEMLSANFMFELISELLSESANINCQLLQGRINCKEVKESLEAGACILTPYDPDFSHVPCLRSGHKAHWALLIGYLISDDNEFFVIARHGKAKNLGVWSLKALSSSNSNLEEFSHPKNYLDCDFLLPEGGIGGDRGLKERAIIVMGIPNETITVL